MAAVRALTGLSDRQLRYYDQQGLVVPRRSPGGHRLYTAAEVDRLLRVRELLSAGLTVRQVAALLMPAPGSGPAGEDG